MASAAPPSSRWLYGMTADLLVGCGGLYMFLFAGLLFAAPQINAATPQFLLPLLALVFSVPHYGGTLVRVYQQREERRKYVVFTVYATVFLCAWFAIGTYYTMIGSLMVTLYITWSPWHYSGQNYGLMLMFLGRRGVTVTPLAKRAIWASFLLSYILTFLGAHTAIDPPIEYTGPTYESIEFVPIGIPFGFTRISALLVLGLYVVAVAVAAAQLLRTGRLRDLFPSAMLLLSQSLWFVVPITVRYTTLIVNAQGSVADSVQPYLWVAIAHALQYLWITSYYAKHSKSWRGYAAYYRNTLLAGSLVWVLPVVIFAPYALGGLPFASGLILLMTALVNLHHFVLDGAIWKLRSSRIASILIRNQDELADDSAAIEPPRRTWFKHVVWATAGVCALAQITIYYQHSIVFPGAIKRGDLALARETIDDLVWFGHDKANYRLVLGDRLREAGDIDGAIFQYKQMMKVETSDLPSAVDALAFTYMKSNRSEEAREMFQRAIDEGYASENTYYNFGTMLAIDDRAREAEHMFRKAIELNPMLARGHRQLATALVKTNRLSEGIEHYRLSLEIEPANLLARRNLAAAIKMQQKIRRPSL